MKYFFIYSKNINVILINCRSITFVYCLLLTHFGDAWHLGMNALNEVSYHFHSFV